jgi:hypothetical protein
MHMAGDNTQDNEKGQEATQYRSDRFPKPVDLTSCRRNTGLIGVLNRLAELVSNIDSTGKACFSKQSDTIQDYKYNKAEMDC